MNNSRMSEQNRSAFTPLSFKTKSRVMGDGSGVLTTTYHGIWCEDVSCKGCALKRSERSSPFADSELSNLEWRVVEAAVNLQQIEDAKERAAEDQSFADNPALSLSERVRLSAELVRELDQRFGWSGAKAVSRLAVYALIAARESAERHVAQRHVGGLDSSPCTLCDRPLNNEDVHFPLRMDGK